MSRPQPIPVSAFIIAKDEGTRIGATIDSLRGLVAEIIVVEWGSSDDTVAVARRHGAQVIHHPWRGYGPQKRFAETCCQQRWLLNLDADEALSPELAEEIRLLFSDDRPDLDAYQLVIRAVCPHEDRPQRWAYANTPVRMYDRECGQFADSLVHDSVLLRTGSRVGRLKHDVYHRGMLSLDQLVAKINGYTSLQAEDFLARKAEEVSFWRLATVVPAAFFKSYILRRHFVWGRYGLVISMSYAFARLLRLGKIHEQRLLADQTQRQNQPIVPLRRSAA
ncbi:MAG: glycosyltransferase family 2 protein [Planctomycetaceae bacterium]